MLNAQEKYLTFNGYPKDAYAFVENIRDAYSDKDMPKVLNDFIFNIEVQLQNLGYLSQDFEPTEMLEIQL